MWGEVQQLSTAAANQPGSRLFDIDHHRNCWRQLRRNDLIDVAGCNLAMDCREKTNRKQDLGGRIELYTSNSVCIYAVAQCFFFPANIERLSLHKRMVLDHRDNLSENGCQALWVSVCVCVWKNSAHLSRKATNAMAWQPWFHTSHVACMAPSHWEKKLC